MCRSRCWSSRRILFLGARDNVVAKVAAKLVRRPKVDRATYQVSQFKLHSGEAEIPWDFPRVKLHQPIDVAVGSEIVPQYGPKERKSLDVVPLAERSELLAVDRNARWHLAASATRLTRKQPIGNTSLSHARAHFTAPTLPALAGRDRCGSRPGS